MLRVWSKVLLVVVGCLVAASVGMAQEQKDKGKKEGGKGKYSAEESFARLDKNGDKKVTKEEWDEGALAKRLGKEKADAAFEKLDTNKDKSVSLEEYKENIRKIFGERKGGDKKGERKGKKAEK